MKRLFDFQKIRGYSDERYPAIDPTTPWAEFNYYCEACRSLGVTNQPHMNRYMAYRSYLKSVGVL